MISVELRRYLIQLQTTFADRDTLAHYLSEQFPQAAERSAEISPIQASRTTGLKLSMLYLGSKKRY